MVLIIGLLCGAVVAVFLVLRNTSGTPPRKPDFPIPALSAEPRAGVPFAAKPVDLNAIPAMADKMDIPQRALQAYAQAEVKTRATTPKCKISWTMLAGIGRKESRHGRYGGATVLDDGTLSKPIIGVPLDGSARVRAIQDTDKGAMDGDNTWDRAVGPMQFLPATWKKWAVRANGDGAPPDPQNMDDSALTAARYLCATGGDLSSPAGWWAAVLKYNSSVEYAQAVFDGQDAYARQP
ncbi:murein transglycosylase [Actinocrispum sp. NPDC049592]|uniref:lytic transglycosylase domain-containing protein n=1 Tax=Actinocrispum sp. NPDC049592 TaxID=3154835 RepID=UPI0034273FF1